MKFESELKLCALGIAVILLMRLAVLGVPALIDSTEGRFASVAKHMFKTGDYLLPQIVKSGKWIHYAAKPPLHIWLMSASFEIFGLSEFSARWPSFLCGLLTVWLTYFFACKIWNQRLALIATLILVSTPMFFGLIGGTLIDVTLCFWVTLTMISFALTVSEGNSKLWGYLFFVACGFGFLTKGPVALAIPGLPIFLWIAMRKQWQLLLRVPWITGIATFLVIASPWYIIAEKRDPGFIRYFFLNENILRYTSSNLGIRFGEGHTYRYGSIWIMLILGFFPWSALIVGQLFRRPSQMTELIDTKGGWGLYCLLWGISPAIFFTFAKHLLATYTLPGFPGLALATALAISNLSTISEDSIKKWHQRLLNYALCLLPLMVILTFLSTYFLNHTGMIVLSLILIALLSYLILKGLHTERIENAILFAALSTATLGLIVIGNYGSFVSAARSTRPVLERILKIENNRTKPLLIAFPFKNPYSARFYDDYLGSADRSITINTVGQHSLDNPDVDYYVVKQPELKKLSKRWHQSFEVLDYIGPWAIVRHQPTLNTSRISANDM